MHSELRSMLQSGLQLGLAVDHADLAVQSFLFLTCIAKCLAAGAAEAGSRARSATLCHCGWMSPVLAAMPFILEGQEETGSPQLGPLAGLAAVPAVGPF